MPEDGDMGVVEVVQSRSQLVLTGIWLLATLLLLGVTQAIGVSEAAGDLSSRNAASDFPLAGADPAGEPHPSVLYGGLMWSVTGARAIPSAELLEPARVEVDLDVTNTLNVTELRAPDSLLGLVALDGSAGTMGRYVQAGTRLAIEPGETVSVTAAFTVGFTREPDLAELGFRIVEPNRVPATIPLDGPRPEEPAGHPIMAAVDTSPAVLADPDDAGRQIVIEPRGVAIDINAGPFRAAEGEQLAIVKVLVQRTSSDETSGFLDTSYWALVADGELTSPVLVTRTDQPASNADELTLLFSFPEGAADLDLLASPNAAGGDGDGEGTEPGASFPVVLPGGR